MTAALSGLTIVSQCALIQDGVTISAAPHLPPVQASARSIITPLTLAQALSGLAIISQRAPVQDGVATISAAPHLPSVQASARSMSRPSTSTQAAVVFNESDRLLARPGPGHVPGVISPGKKRYYVIVVGKCCGLYYDVW